MNFILIVIVLLVAAVAYFKFRESKSHLFYRTLAVIILLFLSSVVYVWLTSGINLRDYDGFLSLGKMYYSWLSSLFHNVGSITGYVAKHDWGVNATAIAP